MTSTLYSKAGADAAITAFTLSGDTTAILGDSIEKQNATTGGSGEIPSAGYVNYANVAGGQRFRVVHINAVIGDNTTQILARLAATLAVGAEWVIVGGADNDPGGGLSVATSTANLKAIYDAVLASGSRLIARTALPGASGFYPTGSALKLAQIDAWTKAYARQRDFVVLDSFAAVADPATGTPATSMTRDGLIHPGAYGAALLGYALAKAVEDRWGKPAPTSLPTSNADPTNLIANGMLLGGGTEPTSWSRYYSAGSGSATSSKVARTDVKGAEWWQFAVTSKVAALQIYQTATGLTAGQTVRFALEFETDTNTAGSYGLDVSVTFQTSGAAYVANLQGIYSALNGGGDSGAPPTDLLLYPRRGIWQAEGIVPATATQVSIIAGVGANFVGTGRYGRALLRVI